MASKRVAFDSPMGDDERPMQRPRLDTTDDVAPSLDSLNDDCLRHILTFLPSDDLNSMAICGSRYQKARAHESLDQTRSGTVVVSPGSTLLSFCESIEEHNWDLIFRGYQTHLKIAGLMDRFPFFLNDQIGADIIGASKLPGVTSLCLAGHLTGGENERFTGPVPFCRLFPNLREVDLTSLIARHAYILVYGFSTLCPLLSRFTWNGCEDAHPLNGFNLRGALNLTEAVLNDCRFGCKSVDDINNLQSDAHPNCFMFHHCKRLRRLSIKNATYIVSGTGHPFQPLSQEFLIKMVRCHPTLRWLRSDLTEENVAMLQLERPEIVFVSD